MNVKSLVGGIAGALMLSSAAMAADIMYTPPPAPPPPPPPAPVKFDWSGPYAGINYTFPVWLGAQVGYNFQPGGAVFGIEGKFDFGFGAPFLAQVTGKIGVALGAEDRLLLYVNGGLMVIGGFVPTVGAGIAIGFGDSAVSWFGQADFIIPGGVLVSTGINFHFN